MTKDQIIARRDLLIVDRASALTEIQHLERMRHTQHGAIQECDHWIRVLAAEEERALDETAADQQRAAVLSMPSPAEEKAS